jgi:hypothetical protein
MGRAITDADTGDRVPPPAGQNAVTLPDGTVVSGAAFSVQTHEDGSVTITFPAGRVTPRVDPDADPGSSG